MDNCICSSQMHGGHNTNKNGISQPFSPVRTDAEDAPRCCLRPCCAFRFRASGGCLKLFYGRSCAFEGPYCGRLSGVCRKRSTQGLLPPASYRDGGICSLHSSPSNSHAKTIAPVARYYRLQEQEDALLAIAAARDDCDSAD